MLHVDFETRSRCNLVEHSSYNYAQDRSTEAACMGYAFDDEPVQMWSNLLSRQKFPSDVADYINEGGIIVAHNATFERLIFWYVICPDFNIPEPKIEQFYCTAAQCRVNGYPAKLENACKALDTQHKKDMRGHQLMMKLCKPARNGSWHEDPEDLERQEQYCLDDVRTERDVHHALRQMTDSELEDYHVCEHINDYGVLIDRDLAVAAQHYAAEELDEIKGLIVDISDGYFETPRQFQKIKEWMLPRMSDEAKSICAYYDNGERKYTLDKNARYNLMEAYHDDQDFLADEVIDIIELLDDAGKSSVSKFSAIEKRADFDTDRLQGAYTFNGASGTGRYSSMGVQVHNLRRDCYKDNNAEAFRELIASGGELDASESVMDHLAKMLRPTFIAEPNKLFVCGDWSAIEGRGLPWLANSRSAEKKLDIYRRGDDPYILTAYDIFDVHSEAEAEHITKDSHERQVGKVAELSLGYGGARGAFKSMAKGYKLHISDDDADRIVKMWRESNPWAPKFWRQLHTAAVNAVRYPGQVFDAGRISYLVTDTLDHQTLWCLLPSGRMISYPRINVKWKKNKWSKYAWELSAMKGNWLPKRDATEWPRFTLWHGLLAENVTQAFCADILRYCLKIIITDGRFPVALHTHDEIVLEVLNRLAPDAMHYLKTKMEFIPEWAQGLPLDAELWTGPRYKK